MHAISTPILSIKHGICLVLLLASSKCLTLCVWPSSIASSNRFWKIREQTIAPPHSLELNQDIRCIFEDSRVALWFGTSGAGVYRYENSVLTSFTTSDDLADNSVVSIQEDQFGQAIFNPFLSKFA